jgi:hypothetical protein
MTSPQQGQVHMMVMPKCNEPSAAAKAAADAKKKEDEKDNAKEVPKENPPKKSDQSTA